MTKKKIVITGGPGTGKTSIISMLEASEFFCFHEVIRDMTQEAKEQDSTIDLVSNPIVSVSDPYQFNLRILNGRIKQFQDAATHPKDIIFYDRGIPDVLAYMDYFDQPYEEMFINACKQHRYDQVFIVPPWKDIYTADEERYESFEQAKEIHNHLLNTYSELEYHCIEVPVGPVEMRMDFILQNS